jgi:hypothetical protein
VDQQQLPTRGLFADFLNINYNFGGFFLNRIFVKENPIFKILFTN